MNGLRWLEIFQLYLGLISVKAQMLGCVENLNTDDFFVRAEVDGDVSESRKVVTCIGPFLKEMYAASTSGSYFIFIPCLQNKKRKP